ncbi:MAG: hypothetical protein Q9195_006909 [Heterodermia aff. obscurata]
MAAPESHKLQIASAKAGLRSLQIAGMRTINFAGEEPLLEPAYLGELARYCSEVLGLESISVSTSGVLVREDWLQRHRGSIDILRIPYRSSTGPTALPPQELMQLCQLCRNHGIRFELYTAVDGLNCEEDMNLAVQNISPHRWTVHKAQTGDGDEVTNGRNNAARGAVVVTDAQFERFCARHRTRQGEDGGYFESRPGEEPVWLDEHMRFMNRHSERPTRSILDVGVGAAWAEMTETA